MTTPEQFLKAYQVVKQDIDTKNKTKEQQKQLSSKKIAQKTWEQFSRKVTTKAFLENLAKQRYGYIYFTTNLKTDCYAEISILFKQYGWNVSDYKWTDGSHRMILILQFPTIST